MLAMPTHRDIPPATAMSLLATSDLMACRGVPFTAFLACGSSIVHYARSRVAKHFLSTDHNRLFWVDSDIGWDAQDFLKIVALSSVKECVGGLYPSKEEPPRFLINFDDPKLEMDRYGCFELKGAGLGFVCVQRTVIEQLADRADKINFHDMKDVPNIFRNDIVDGDARGEDNAFFADVRSLGYRAWFDPRVKLAHIGPKAYGLDFMSTLARANAPRSEARREEVSGETVVRVLPEGPVSPEASDHRTAA